MVLGLIDFLLGGKKKTKVPRSGQVTTPLNSVGGSVEQNPGSGGVIPDGQSTPTKNVSGENGGNSNIGGNNTLKFESSSTEKKPVVSHTSVTGNKKSISDVISKIHDELKKTNEKMTDVVTDVKSLENSVNTLGHRIDELEESKKSSDDKVDDINRNMTKFLSLYELINNQYNPFVENGVEVQKEPIVVSANGSSGESSESELGDKSSSETSSFDDMSPVHGVKSIDLSNSSNFDSSLMELDTLNIEDAAADAVPLVSLKNNTNSLVTILSWLEYLIKREGIDETRNSLRYYTETLRWITPEVFFDLDKYLRGMKDKKNLEGDESLTVRDHIVSLYFISKLNEKVLDEKLTRAVLQIIKE